MTQTSNTASLQIIDLTEEDSGAYQCSISNRYGRTRSSAELHSGAPSYVRNIRLTGSGDGYAVLDWDPPLEYYGAVIGGYQVQAIRKNGGDTRTVDVGPAETTVRIDGLNGDSGGYTYRVRARSTGGIWGPWTIFDGFIVDPPEPRVTSQLLTWLLPLLIVLLLLLILLVR
ncbi:twitchin-like [Branchiostoma floridae]|uniref:Twitchin-like n=1 Tax=Branchiostoma floridae TaxID=7739 RepID=A0A9J7LPG8_BRAFL|nr:twitchin-like [Branchiostoma floridae]